MSYLDFLSDVVLSLLVGQSLLDELGVLSLRVLLIASLDLIGVLSDLSMNLLVEVLNRLGSALLESLKPSLELDVLLLSSLEDLEVFVDMDTQNSLSEFNVVSLRLAGIISRETGS